MKTRKTLTKETAKRYCTAGKKEKTKVIYPQQSWGLEVNRSKRFF